MRQPSVTMASYFPLSASVRACEGISNAPGTRTTPISSLRQPLRRSASSAPCRSRSVMNEFHRLTTTPKRMPRAFKSPSIASSVGRFFCQKSTFDPLAGSATRNRESHAVCRISADVFTFSFASTSRIESRSVTSTQISAWIVSRPSTNSICPSGTLNGAPWPRAVFQGVPRSKPIASKSLLSALNSLLPATWRIVVMPLIINQSFYRPRASRIFRRCVFLEQLFCQLNILLRHLQPHAADDFTGQRMHAMHVLIAQETVYATGVQQTLGDVRLMQVIENGGRGKLVWFPVWMHGYLPWKFAARFSRKAVVPSFLSSVAQHMPNRVASRKRPSGSVMFMPWFTASMQYWIANG